MRKGLLAGAGIGALLALAVPAQAENRMQYFGSAEGSFLFSEIQDVEGAYFYDGINTAGCGNPAYNCYRDAGATDIGWGGRLQLGMKVDQWSFALGALVQQSYGDDKTNDRSGDGDNYEFDNTATYWAIDFDVGMEFGLGEGGMVRPFVGVRYAEVDFEQDGSVLYNTGAGYGTYDLNSKAWGFGPRAGASLHLPVGGGFSLDAEAAAFVLFGQLERVDETDFVPGVSYRDESDETFFGAEAELGVSYNFGLSQHTEGFVTLGYRVDWIGGAVQGEQTLYDSHLADPLYRGGGEEDYLTHGPFISFTFRN